MSIDRQERELRELARSEGWTVTEDLVFRDDGLSGRVERQKADEALQALADGDADVLLVWELSRWSRMGLSAVAKLVTVVRERDGALFVAKKEGLRSDQPAFGIMAAVIAEVASMEAEGTRDRITSMRAHVLSATEPGEQRWLGGSPPFGYRAQDREGGAGRVLVVDSYEAAYVREGARLFAEGATLAHVTGWLTADGVATPQSPARRARQAGKAADGLDAGEWRITTVRKLFQSPTLLGRTTRRMQVGGRVETRVVTDAQGLPITRWQPLLDAGTFAAVQARFAARGPHGAPKAASWLSGLLFCDLCGSVMYANSGSNRTDTFRCSNKAVPGRYCPGVSVSRAAAEQHMEEMLLGMIGGLPEYRVTERVEGADPGELDDVAQAIVDVQGALAADGADYPALLGTLDGLKERRRKLLDAPGRTVRTSTPTGRALSDAWSEGGTRERKALIAGMLQGVMVRKPSGHGRASRVEDRLEPVWVEEFVEDDYR